jgi:X-X-X-Leu-X-X-Gly heptad repeat protein
MRNALLTLYVRHSRACHHDYRRACQVLDIDFTGLLAGKQGELVTKGYFSDHPHKRGRQVGRVLATRYDEILSERLYAGTQQLASGLQQLVEDAELILNLQQPQRQRTLLRVDGGGGGQLAARTGLLLARQNVFGHSCSPIGARSSRISMDT